MNKKIFLIATLLLLTIVSLGTISAEEIDDNVISDDPSAIEVGNGVNEDVVDEGERTTIEIDSSMGNAAIQEQLNSIQNHTTINFAYGTYENTNLTIGSDGERLSDIIINGNGATLKGTPKPGSGDPTQQGDLNNYVGIFEVKGIDGFTLSGFNFIAEGQITQITPKSPSCVIIYATKNGIIENNNITGGRFGLYVGNKFQNGNDSASNYDTIIRNNTITGVADMGIINFGSPRSKIINNTVINPANHGIDVRHGKGPNVLVQNNTVIGAKEGIYLMHSIGHNATENKLINCDEGIVCFGSKNIIIDYNNFTNTRIRILLSSGYSNINVGEHNDFGKNPDVPFPPSFAYYIVRADSDYVNSTSGTFSEGDNIVNPNITKVQFYYVSEEGDTINITEGSINEIDPKAYGLNNIIVKIWVDDTNPIAEGTVVKVAIDGAETNMTADASGAVNVDLSTLGGGQHYVTVNYAGDDTFKGCSWSAVFKVPVPVVTPKATTINATAITATAKIAKNLVFTLKDSNGAILANKKVKVSVNGKTTTVTTNYKGQATIKVNMTKAGTYYYSLCFLGDNNYKASFKIVKVTVNKQATKASFAARTFKLKATKKAYFYLKDASGKALASKKITFTVNKRTYTAYTNSKGVATVTFKISRRGKYLAIAKFAGDSAYNAATRRAYMTIR